MLLLRRISISRRATHVRYFNAAANRKQKRALTPEQVHGQKVKVTPVPPPPPTKSADPKPVAASNSGVPIVPIGVGLLALAGGYYYYTTTLDKDVKPIAIVDSAKEKNRGLPTEKKDKSSDSAALSVPKSSVLDTSANEKVDEESPAGVKTDLASETSRAINGGESDGTASDSAASQGEWTLVGKPDSDPSKRDDSSIETSPADLKNEAASVKTEEDPPLKEEAVVLVENTSMTDKAIEALQEETARAAARSLVDTHESLALSVVDDFDNMSTSQLKAKIFQLSAELQDRTKWEAMRLKEFLVMKEKETAAHYLEIVQKQRLELEDMMAKKLRGKEEEHASAMLAALQAKEAAIQSVVQAALDAQKEEHEADKLAFQDIKSSEIALQMEEQFGKEVEEYKEKTAQELQKKTEILKQLTDKLQVLETALETTQATKQGSLKAHRLSAAALALSEKLETSSPAADELVALQMAAGNEGVIATACATIPETVKSGVPTIPMLQARFAKVAKKCRQGLLVPEGELGLEGQLTGMLLATVRSPPEADDKMDDDEVKLVQAHELVAIGALEEAIDLLEKMPGQASLILQDWKKVALERVAIEKSLKVIKMECALLNKSCVVESEET